MFRPPGTDHRVRIPQHDEIALSIGWHLEPLRRLPAVDHRRYAGQGGARRHQGLLIGGLLPVDSYKRAQGSVVSDERVGDGADDACRPWTEQSVELFFKEDDVRL